jgi:hypothetical protein
VPTLTILDPDGATVAPHSVPGRTDRDWSVHAGAPAADERRFLLTYHGGNTTGADWIDLTPGALRRCASRESDKACIFEIHGGVELYRDGFLATTGSRVLEVSREGHIVRHLPLAPRNVHLMDFVRNRSQLYVSSCGRRPAILGLDLAHARVQRMRSGRFCGAPFAVGAGFLVISADRVRRGYAGEDPRLRLIDLADAGARRAGTPSGSATGRADRRRERCERSRLTPNLLPAPDEAQAPGVTPPALAQSRKRAAMGRRRPERRW